MMEPMFGSASPAWTSVPQPSFGWLSAAPPIGVHPINSGAQGIGLPAPTSQLTAFQNTGDVNSGVQASLPIGPSAAFGLSPFGAIGSGSSFVGPLPAAELSMVPAPALLATVAMRRGQPQGPTTDTEIEEFLYDAIDLLAGSSEVEIHSEGGRATLTGSVSQRRLKRDIGEIAWALPRVSDVQNNLTITARRRPRTSTREAESPTHAAGRKSA